MQMKQTTVFENNDLLFLSTNYKDLPQYLFILY